MQKGVNSNNNNNNNNKQANQKGVNNSNNNNNNNPATSKGSPQVTCIVSPPCFLTPRDVAIGILAKSDLLRLSETFSAPLRTFHTFVRNCVNLCEVSGPRSIAVEFSSCCVISTLCPDVSKDRSAVSFQGQAVQQQSLFFTVWRFKLKTVTPLETSITTYPTSHSHISEEIPNRAVLACAIRCHASKHLQQTRHFFSPTLPSSYSDVEGNWFL